MAKLEDPAEAPVGARPSRPVQPSRFAASPENGGPKAQPAQCQPAQCQPAECQPAECHVAGIKPAAPDTPDPARHASSGHGRRSTRELLDEAFDTTRNLESPAEFAEFEAFSDEALSYEASSHEASSHEASSNDAALDDRDLDDGAYAEDELFADAPRVEVDVPEGRVRQPGAEPRPGLAWVRPGSAGSRVPKLPMANLERPSTSRVELTPSPVPRVALAPATGALDISLVPGPHSVGSRNLPTVAPQHLVGRRPPRRPAPAVTVPPPSVASPRSALDFARDVRSSKGEIVLGLTIGLGVSLLLAGLGQAYLRGDLVADEQSAPTELESVTLSARPDGVGSASDVPGRDAAGRDVSGRDGSGRDAAGRAGINAADIRAADVRAGAVRPAVAGKGAGQAAATRVGSGAVSAPNPERSAGGSGMSSVSQRAARAAGEVPAEPASRVRGINPALLAQAPGAKPVERTLPRATPVRATRAARSEPSGSASPWLELDDAPVPPPGAQPSERPPSRTAPLTPAQSAGLGLDLPL